MHMENEKNDICVTFLCAETSNLNHSEHCAENSKSNHRLFNPACISSMLSDVDDSLPTAVYVTQSYFVCCIWYNQCDLKYLSELNIYFQHPSFRLDTKRTPESLEIQNAELRRQGEFVDDSVEGW